MSETSAPRIADWTLARVGTTDDGRFNVALLVFGQDNFIYTLWGGGEKADPLTDLGKIASSLFDSSLDDIGSFAEVDYRLDGLWGRLPRIQHFPPGFIYSREFALIDESAPTTVPTATMTLTPTVSPTATTRPEPRR